MRRTPEPSRDLPAAALFALALAGCANDADNPYFGTTERLGKDPGTYYVNNSSEPEFLDPGKCADGVSTVLVSHLFEGLTTYDPRDMHPVQGVATSWDQSDDNRLFRFHLRPDAKWSDGKPVTAHDFEYAWKRVLTPATASRGAESLYSLLNGELFATSMLKVTAKDLVLRAEPRADAPAGEKLAKGAAVRILARSPSKVTTAVAPLAEVPAGVKAVSFSKADAKKGTAEELSFGGARPAARPAAGGGWKDASVTLLGVGAPVTCDGAEDHWFQVQRGAERGWLPGCLLGQAKADKAWSLVERHDKLPTFKAAPLAPAPEAAAAPTGFIEESDLIEDATVLGVRARDDLTLEVELQNSTPFFLDLTSYPVLFPVRRDVVEPFEKRNESELWYRPESIVSNGPYVLDEWRFRDQITMKANPYWTRRDKIKIHRIVWLEIEDYHTTMNLYKAGEVDALGDNLAPPSEYQGLLSTKKDYLNNPFLSIYWYELNTQKPPLDDARVRKALNLAIDKQLLIDKVTRGHQTLATHFVPDFTGLGYSEQVAADKAAGADPFSGPGMDYDPERARALMKEAGYDVVKDGAVYRADKCPPVEILYNTSEGHRNIAVAIQDMWKKNLGVTATLRNEEWKIMLKNQRDGQFQAGRGGWTADYNHPHTFLDVFQTASPQNHTGWGDPAFDEALRKAAATPDRKESIRLYRKAEKILTDAMPRIPLYFYTKSTLVKPWVKGFYGLPRGNHLVQYLWIDPDWKSHPDNEPAYKPEEFPPPGVIAP